MRGVILIRGLGAKNPKTAPLVPDSILQFFKNFYGRYYRYLRVKFFKNFRNESGTNGAVFAFFLNISALEISSAEILRKNAKTAPLVPDSFLKFLKNFTRRYR